MCGCARVCKMCRIVSAVWQEDREIRLQCSDVNVQILETTAAHYNVTMVLPAKSAAVFSFENLPRSQ